MVTKCVNLSVEAISKVEEYRRKCTPIPSFSEVLDRMILESSYQSVVPDSTKGEKRMSKEWKETEYRMTEQAYIGITKRKEELMSKNPKLTRDEAVKLAIHQLLKEGL